MRSKGKATKVVALVLPTKKMIIRFYKQKCHICKLKRSYIKIYFRHRLQIKIIGSTLDNGKNNNK